ncbi:TetR/AcrR family transcriptional regulator [Bradyrhizobium sp. Tv2a-2]|uniref:TetR/AcrR family transcriptional regulator n=1 Tax=Bradyrhizobium sp. Tv2a-2 TaxID=113395 RepID=UPI000419BE70|nr:TetR/AcrR family transcriptional regulator [Bradyrhizobium sp. Tv2a-2]
MADQLSAKDWLDAGLKALAASGFTALKAEPLSKALKVSRGSFYWHFADLNAFHAAVLAHWREVAAERIIADLESAPAGESPIRLLLRRTFSGRLALERAVRSWATSDAQARSAVQAIDRRRLDYVSMLLRDAGLPAEIAQARAQILYWAFIGYALSDKPLPKTRQEAVLDELMGMALALDDTRARAVLEAGR